MKVVFTTDLHSEIWKYDRLLKAAQDFRADVIINGGDMLPKSLRLTVFKAYSMSFINFASVTSITASSLPRRLQH